MNDQFLPENYTIPVKESTGGRYLNKFEEGETRIRILSRPIIGYEYWVDSFGNIRDKSQRRQKGDKPIRIKEGSTVSVEQFEQSKYFWAMVVWNYREEMIQIAKIDKVKILKAIQGYAKDPDWGSPLNYDILVKRSGTKLDDTEYDVIPKPSKPLSDQVKKEFEKVFIDLDAWMRSEDPFTEKTLEQNISETVATDAADEIPF